MFLSFDMSTFDCVTTARLQYFQDYLDLYLPHPAAATFQGKAILSTFGGEWCTWGQGSGVNATNTGWGLVMGDRRNSTYYMPAYTMGDGPRSLNQYDIDAELNWGSAWPTGDTDLTTENDDYWMSFLPNKYVATVAPSFFTHFGYKASRFSLYRTSVWT
jgi:glucan endo-1,3-alpha-glucosidase